MAVASRRIHLMGTVIDMKIWHTYPDPLLDEVESLLHTYRKIFSANDADSDLMAVNRMAGLRPVLVKPELFDLIAIGKQHSCVTGSHLNIAIGPLVQTWRIGFSNAQVPDENTIAEKCSLIQPQDIVLDENAQTVYLAKKGMMIDLGALAKGYIADKIMEHLRQSGVSSALINLGGNILTMGEAQHRKDKSWYIGVQDPHLLRGEQIAFLRLKAGSVVTSGIYERTVISKGKTYHHLLDSRTGYPMETDLASLTIVSETSIEGEIWTSRLFGKSIPEIEKELAEKMGIEGILITRDGRVLYTDGLEGKIQVKS